MNIIQAIKSGNEEKITSSLVNAISEKQDEILNIKKIAVASEIFNGKQES